MSDQSVDSMSVSELKRELQEPVRARRRTGRSIVDREVVGGSARVASKESEAAFAGAELVFSFGGRAIGSEQELQSVFEKKCLCCFFFFTFYLLKISIRCWTKYFRILNRQCMRFLWRRQQHVIPQPNGEALIGEQRRVKTIQLRYFVGRRDEHVGRERLHTHCEVWIVHRFVLLFERIELLIECDRMCVHCSTCGRRWVRRQTTTFMIT